MTLFWVLLAIYLLVGVVRAWASTCNQHGIRDWFWTAVVVVVWPIDWVFYG